MEKLLSGAVEGNSSSTVGNPQMGSPVGGNLAEEKKSGVEVPAWAKPLGEYLPEELKQEKSLANFKNLHDLAKGYMDTKAALSKKMDGMIKIPGEGSTPEEWAAYHKALGRPDKPEEYNVPHIDGVTMPVEDVELQWFRETAHKYGMNQKQFAAIYGGYLQRREAALQQLNDSARKVLESEYPGERYHDQLALWRIGLNQLPEAVRKNIEQRQMIDIDLFKVVSALGALYRSDRAPESRGQDQFVSGINYARVEEIDKIISDPKTMSSERQRLIAEKRQIFANVKNPG